MAAEAVDSSSAILAVLGDGRLSPDSGSLALASHHRLELLLFDSLLRSERISTRTRAAAVAALERAGRDNTRLFDDLQSVISILADARSEEHTSELQSLMRTSYAVFCLKKKIHLEHNKIIK